MRRLLVALVSLLALPFAYGTRAAAAENAISLPGGEGVVLRDGRLETGVATGSLGLPPGSEIRSLAHLDGGWLASGTQPAVGEERELLLARSVHGALELLPPPPGRSGSRQGAVPLVADGDLVAVAWLEGRGGTSNAVRVSGWTGVGWTRPETVGPPGFGSQLALTGTVASDGSRLLAWSSFDGEDDEILWSRAKDDEEWSTPRRIAEDNPVPDITPALTTDGMTTRLAWNRYDGTRYRLLVADFRDDGWSEPRTVAVDGLYPSWERLGEHTALVVHEPSSREWVALDLDRQGRVRASLWIPGHPGERPRLVSDEEGPAVLLGNGERRRLRWRR